MPPQKIRLILDTNIWISFFLTRRMEKFEEILFTGYYLFIFSPQLIVEIKSVLLRDKFSKIIKASDLNFLDLFIANYGLIVSPETEVDLCRDEKDNFLLSLAIDARANFLLTGDQDLLILDQIASTKIITYSDWLKIHENQR